MGKPSDTPLPLSAAVLKWSAPTLVEDVRRHERLCSRYQLNQWRWPRLVLDDELRQPTGTDWMAGGSSALPELRNAWEKIENEFRRLVRAGELHLSGVLVKPELTTEPQLIPGAWASELKFDLIGDAAMLPPRKFANVVVSRHSPAAIVVSPERPSGAIPPITQENLRDLTDEEVLLLLNDHADRVIKSGGMLIPPGKVTLLPIIRSKMRDRSAQGDLLEGISVESVWLSNWIKERVGDNIATPTAKTIGKVLGSEYALLKPRSNAAIQKSKA